MGLVGRQFEITERDDKCDGKGRKHHDWHTGSKDSDVMCCAYCGQVRTVDNKWILRIVEDRNV